MTTEPTTWAVAVTAGGHTEHTTYRNGKAAHGVASDASRQADHATVTFNGCVTTYRDGIGRDAEHDAEHLAATLTAADWEPCLMCGEPAVLAGSNEVLCAMCEAGQQQA
jgi:hypothetical protein